MFTLKKPVLQGELDGLCGLYSVINAICILWNYPSKTLSRRLFRRGIRWLDENENLKSIVLDGMYFTTLKFLSEELKEYIEGNYTFNYYFETIIPSKNIDISSIWSAIEAYLKNTQGVVIIGFQSKKGADHWTVIMRATKKAWFLYDSDGTSEIRKIMKDELTLEDAWTDDTFIRVNSEEILGVRLEKKRCKKAKKII